MELGRDKFGNALYWNLEESVNGHLFCVGTSGEGKTYKICQMLKECSKNSTIVIFDSTNLFKETLLEVGIEENEIYEYLVYEQGLPVNLFKRQSKMIGSKNIPETNSDLAERVLESLRNIIGKAPRQRARVRNVLNNLVAEKEEEATLFDLRQENLKYEDAVAWTLDDKFTIFGNLTISKNVVEWEAIEQDKRVFLINLAGYEKPVMQFVVDVILQDMWHYMKKRKIKKKIIICLDELQNYQISKEHVICDFLAEGRKYGVNIWCATQNFKANFPENIKELLMQAGVKMFFKASNEELENMAKLIDRKDKGFWSEVIRTLTKGTFVCMGDVSSEFQRINVPVIISAIKNE